MEGAAVGGLKRPGSAAEDCGHVWGVEVETGRH